MGGKDIERFSQNTEANLCYIKRGFCMAGPGMEAQVLVLHYTAAHIMKALIKQKSEPGLWLEDVPEPKIGINDVLIRVDRTGICGTDVHIYKWDDWARRTIPVPMVVGHEFVGEIVEIGSNVKDFFPGQVVSGEGHVVC